MNAADELVLAAHNKAEDEEAPVAVLRAARKLRAHHLRQIDLDPSNRTVHEAKALLAEGIIAGRLQAIGGQIERDLERIINLIEENGTSTGEGKKSTDGVPWLAEEVIKIKKRIELRLTACEERGVWGPGYGSFDNLVEGYQAEKKCSRGEAIRAVATEYPEAHERYLQELHG